MANDVQVALRLPAEMVKRADKILKRVAKDRQLAAWGRISRASVLRLAILRGLEALEREYTSGGH